MENIVEFLILFDLSLFFTVFSFILKTLPWRILFRVFSMNTWFVLGLFYSLTSPLVPAVGFFFYIMALSFLVTLFADIWMAWDKKSKAKWGMEE